MSDAILESFKARLLGPFTYHSVPDAGAAGATVTVPLLGDAALTFAIHHAVHGHPIPFRFGARGPDYAADYARFATIASVGVPAGPVDFLAPEYVASNFMSEGFEQIRISTFKHFHGNASAAKSLVENTPWRPWRRIQSLAPSEGARNIFSFSAVSRKPLPDRFTIRVGLGRGCLLAVEKIPQTKVCAVNRHTVEGVLKRPWGTVPHSSRSAPLAQLQIYHGVPVEAARDLLKPLTA